MTTLNMTKLARAPRLSPEHVEKALLQSRIDNIGKKFVATLDESESRYLLTLPDDELWSEIKTMALTQSLINNLSKEKEEQEDYAEARLAFLKSLEKYGGVHKSTAVKKILGVSVPTVHKYSKQNKLIVLDWGAEKLYPVFQFSVDEKNSENGMLKGVPELLACLTHNVSNLRKCNFFTRQVEMPGCSEKISALDILRRGATDEEMTYLRILAENFGTQNSV